MNLTTNGGLDVFIIAIPSFYVVSVPMLMLGDVFVMSVGSGGIRSRRHFVDIGGGTSTRSSATSLLGLLPLPRSPPRPRPRRNLLGSSSAERAGPESDGSSLATAVAADFVGECWTCDSGEADLVGPVSALVGSPSRSSSSSSSSSSSAAHSTLMSGYGYSIRPAAVLSRPLLLK